MNTDLVSRLNNVGTVFSTILDTMTKGDGGGGGQTREKMVVDVCKDRQTHQNSSISQRSRPTVRRWKRRKPINICLKQEVDVLDKVLDKVIKTLKDLQLAIDDNIVMSDDLTESLDVVRCLLSRSVSPPTGGDRHMLTLTGH